MKKLFFGLVFIIISIAFINIVKAEDVFNSSSIQMQGRIEGIGTYFEITNSEYLNIKLNSSESIKLTLESVPEMVTINIDSSTSAIATSTQITLSGFNPLTTYYKYEDDYHNLTEFVADENGNYSYIQDLFQPHLVFIQPRKSTKFIKDDATGGDCYLIGVWDISTKTCTLTTDLNETIQIDSNYVTLDGNNHLITGSRTGNGVYLYQKTGVTMKNLNVQRFDYGIHLYYSWGNILTNNVASDNRIAISLRYSSKNTLTSNTILNNVDGIEISNSDGNTLTSNIASNNFSGIFIAESMNNVITDNITQENFLSDINVIAGTYKYCYNSIVNTLGSGGRPIKYFNGAVNLSNETLAGLILCNADGSKISNITIEGSTTKRNNSLLLMQTDFSTIENVSSSNNFLGIILFSSNRNALKNNTVSDNNQGLSLYFSNNNILTNNTTLNNHLGIYFIYSDYNILTNNLASNNNQGIILEFANRNQIYKNNFINNRIQTAVINSGGNLFNLDKPTGGNYWSNFDTSIEGCNDLNSDNICDSPYKFYGGQDSLPWKLKDGWLLRQPIQFYSEVQNEPRGLRLRASPGVLNKPESDTIKILPNSWAVHITNTVDANGNNIDLDGYRWYQVYDATDNTTGWMAAKKLSDGTVYLDYNPSLQGDSTNKGELEQKATDLKDILEKRIPVILNAVTDYYTKDNSDSSLYGGGGGDGNNNFQRFIQGSAFPKELVLAIASQESGPSFNNEICSGANDGGIGIMQITSNELKGLGSGLDNKLHKNDCRSGESFSKYYSNTYQGIWANIKDGFRALQGKYDSVGVTQEVDNISALEMKAISTTYRYNQGSPYKVQAVYAIYDGENNDYAWNEYLHYVFNRTDADVWAQSVRNACASAASFASCLNITENLRLTTSAFYLRDVGGRLKSSPFGESYQNSILGEKLITANTSKIIAFLRSPAELVAINSLGERTGIARGNILQNISNSSYEEDKNLLTIFFPRENYIYRVTGTATGEYGFSANFFRGNDIIVFDGRDIPIKLQEIHDYIFDWDKMSYCEQGAVTLKIDYEGDGVYDRIIINDCKIYDIEPPQITISPIENEYLLNSTLQINFSATDNLSGVSSIVATLNGAEITNGQILILTKPGINTLKISATDNEGNEAILEKTFNVMYNFGGFLPPIKIDGTGVYNLGRTLPVKFQLSDVNGNFVSTASAQLYVAKISDGIIGNDEIPLSTSSADTDNQFRYDLTNNQYIYNLSTGILTIGSWQLKAVLDSGQISIVVISIK